jgi:hypothetical protein
MSGDNPRMRSATSSAHSSAVSGAKASVQTSKSPVASSASAVEATSRKRANNRDADDDADIGAPVKVVVGYSDVLFDVTGKIEKYASLMIINEKPYSTI